MAIAAPRHRRGSLLAVGVSLALALGVAACGGANDSQAREREVLVVTQTAGYHHKSIADAQRLLSALGRESRDYEVKLLPDVRSLTPARLARAKAVVFANTSGTLPMTAAQRSALLSFIRNGGGFVGTHSAADTFHHWPAYIAMLGAEFQRHPYVGDGRVIVEDRNHPATAALPASFRIKEEFYFFKTNPRRRAHVLARLDVGSFGGNPREDRPLVWCRREGRGRVFYDALGHAAASWSDARQRALIAGGLAWALGLRSGRC